MNGLECHMQVETIYLGDRKLSVRTSVLEEKATACNMLCCYADELKDGFYPYVEQARPPMHTPCTPVPLRAGICHKQTHTGMVSSTYSDELSYIFRDPKVSN